MAHDPRTGADQCPQPEAPAAESDWICVLTEVAERCQVARSEREVAAMIAEGGTRLGFERASLWRLGDDRQQLEGLAQAGAASLPDLVGLHIPLHEFSYGRSMPHERAPRRLGPGELPYLARAFAGQGFTAPVGDWVSVPLWNDDQLQGILILDNVSRSEQIGADLLRVLELFGHQAAAALERVRKTYERDWLQALAEVAEAAQRATSEREVIDAAVQGGLRFGFTRVRLWQRADDGRSLVGVGHAGNSGLDDFEGFVMPIAETVYLHDLLERRDPVRIPGRRDRPGYMDHHFASAGFAAPAGEWVCVPLWIVDQLWGALMLDNDELRPLARPDQHQVRLLRLLGRQIEAALERVHKRDERDWLEILTNVAEEVQRALSEREIAEIVVRGGLRLGFARARLWKLSDDGASLVGLSQAGNRGLDQFAGLRVPLAETVYGKLLWEEDEVRIFDGGERPILLDRLFGPQGFAPPAGQWVEIPLWAGSHRLGTLTLDNADERCALRPHQRSLLKLFGDQVAAALERAARYEDQRRRGEEREVLSWAGAELMRYVSERPERDDWLWRGTLMGAVWARQTLGFNRAMLFLCEESGALRGRVGVEIARPLAPRRRREGRQLHRVMRGYLRRLVADQLRPAPFDRLVAGWALAPEAGVEAFQAVLGTGRRLVIRAGQAAEQLPPAFLECFGAADYALLPLRVGEKALGVVVVDNAYEGDTVRRAALDQLEALLERAAMTYEIVHQRRAREELIALNYTVMANMRSHSLRDTLRQVCEAAREATGAASATIYPFVPGSEPYVYDDDNIVSIGGEPIRLARLKPRQRGITTHIVRAGTLVVPDVQAATERYDGRPLADYGLLQQERIRAFIGAPIRDMNSGETAGVLYIDYRAPQSFVTFDQQLVESFASLAAVAIRNARFDQSVQDHLLDRERELTILKRVLEQALVIDLDGGESSIARSLLDAARDLLRHTETNAWAGLLLRKWERPDVPSDVSRRERHKYYWQADGKLGCVYEPDTELGITSAVLSSSQAYRTGDVTCGPPAALFRQGVAQHTRSELDVPIWLEPERRAIGVLNIELPLVNAFTERHQAMIERLAAVAALALGNLRRLGYLHDVLKAIRAVTTSIRLPQILETVRDAARDITPGVAVWTIWYREPESKRIRLGPYFGVLREDRMLTEETEDSVVTRVMNTSEPIWARSAAEDALLRGRFVAEEGIASTAAFPLRAGDEAVGAMFFSYRAEQDFGGEERLFFPMIAAIAAAGVQNALQLEATQKERDRLQAAMTVTRAIGTTLDLSQGLTKILETLRRLFPGVSVFVVTYNHLEESLVFTPESHDFYQIDHQDYAGRTSFPISGESVASQLARRSLAGGQVEMVNIGDARDDPSYLNLISSTRSELCLTLVSDGRLLGVLVLESAEVDAFDQDDEALVRSVGYQIGLALDRAHQSAQLRFKTALAARTAWAAEIAHDINTELGKIRGLVYLLRHNPALAEARRDIAEIERSAERLAGTFYELQPGRLSQIYPLSPDELVRSALADIHLGDGVAVDLDLACAGATIYAAEVTVRRILHHLIRNAREAMGGQGTISIRTSCDGQRVSMEIGDTGPGIPDDQRQLIFNQPVTTKDREGGLGLLFVRSSIEDLNGTIRLLPWAPGRGAVFMITLPLSHTLGTWKE